MNKEFLPLKNKTIIVIILLALITTSLCFAQKKWPVLKHYDLNHTDKIALPIGGIGTGTVSLGGNGTLRDWEIMNRAAKGYWASAGGNQIPFFAIYTKTENGEKMTRGLMVQSHFMNMKVRMERVRRVMASLVFVSVLSMQPTRLDKFI